jgi:hypothetical protein
MLIEQLYKNTKKPKGNNVIRFQRYEPNYIHQMDLLFLPNDGGYKYALVIADVGNRLVDAEPVKNKQPKTINTAIKKIYSRNILSYPKIITVDNGTEFKGLNIEFFKDKNIYMKKSKPYRHRQLAVVERKNQLIGTKLFKRMTEQELLTNYVSKEWVSYLPIVIKELNKTTKRNNKKITNKDVGVIPLCDGDACNILSNGTKVRVKLDAPINPVDNKILKGRFRSTDIKFEIKPRTVLSMSWTPGLPPLYYVNKLDNENEVDMSTAYSKDQLLVVKSNEKLNNKNILPIKNLNTGYDEYVVEKIIKRKKIKNRIYYQIKWKGFDDLTLEPRSKLIQDIPDLIKQFESNQKLK